MQSTSGYVITSLSLHLQLTANITPMILIIPHDLMYQIRKLYMIGEICEGRRQRNFGHIYLHRESNACIVLNGIIVYFRDRVNNVDSIVRDYCLHHFPRKTEDFVHKISRNEVNRTERPTIGAIKQYLKEIGVIAEYDRESVRLYHSSGVDFTLHLPFNQDSDSSYEKDSCVWIYVMQWLELSTNLSSKFKYYDMYAVTFGDKFLSNVLTRLEDKIPQIRRTWISQYICSPARKG
jgi:hypothetical protein